MTSIAKWLLKTHTATTPPVDLIVYLGLLDKDGSFDGGDRLHCLVSSLSGVLSLDLSMHLEVEVRLVVLAKRFGGIFWLDDPRFRWDLLHLSEEVASGP